MKLSPLALVFATLLLAPTAFAGVLEVQNGTKVIHGKTISVSGKITVEGKSVELTTVGAGLRTALGGVVAVYVGELLVSDKTQYACQPDQALNSAARLPALAMRLQFSYGINMSQLEGAFKDGFDANDVDADNPDIAKFMAAIHQGGDIPDGAELVFVGEKLANGQEAVIYQSARGAAVTVEGAPGLIRSIFSLWLGNPGSDPGLKNLNDKLKSCQI